MAETEEDEHILLCVVATAENANGESKYIYEGSVQVPCSDGCGRTLWTAPLTVVKGEKRAALANGKLTFEEVPDNIVPLCSECALKRCDAAGDWQSAAQIRVMAEKMGEPVGY